MLHVEGTVYKGDELPPAWAMHFESQATPVDSGFDSVFYEYINEQYSQIGEIPWMVRI